VIAPSAGFEGRRKGDIRHYADILDVTCFPFDGVEPAGLHVAAKLYLCAVDREYFARLSEPSQRSQALQGGPISAAEVSVFEANPHGVAAERLRRWDDAAKVPGLATPPIEHFVAYINQCARDSVNPP
jgi:predicted HD phosphohydrolase